MIKHPCKGCIVNGICSQDCDKYKRFKSNSAEWATFIGMLLSCLIISPTVLYLSNLMNNGHEWAELALLFIWIFGFIVSTIIQAPMNEEDQVTFIPRVMFSPFIAICFITFYILKPYVKRA